MLTMYCIAAISTTKHQGACNSIFLSLPEFQCRNLPAHSRSPSAAVCHIHRSISRPDLCCARPFAAAARWRGPHCTKGVTAAGMGATLAPRARIVQLTLVLFGASTCWCAQPDDKPASWQPQARVLTDLGHGRHSVQLQLPAQAEAFSLAIGGWQDDACNPDVLP